MNPCQYKDYTLNLAYPKTKQLYMMRSYVKTVELKNLDFFTKRNKIVFDKYNIIQGDKKSGKTFLSYLIYNAYMFNDTFLDKFLEGFPLDFTGFNDAKIKIVYHSTKDWTYSLPKKNKSNNMHDRWRKKCYDTENNGMCFLFDEPDIIYDEKKREGFLNFLKNTNAQMIVTTNLEDDYEYPKEYNIIKI